MTTGVSARPGLRAGVQLEPVSTPDAALSFDCRRKNCFFLHLLNKSITRIGIELRLIKVIEVWYAPQDYW